MRDISGYEVRLTGLDGQHVHSLDFNRQTALLDVKNFLGARMYMPWSLAAGPKLSGENDGLLNDLPLTLQVLRKISVSLGVPLGVCATTIGGTEGAEIAAPARDKNWRRKIFMCGLPDPKSAYFLRTRVATESAAESSVARWLERSSVRVSGRSP